MSNCPNMFAADPAQPRIALGFGDCLREPALLLGGRQLGNEVDAFLGHPARADFQKS